MTDAPNIYRCSPRQVSEFTQDCLMARVVPFIQSSPGMGKSSIVRQIAKLFNLKLIDLRLSTCAPEDMSGLPEFFTDEFGQRRARFVPFDMFPLEFNELPKDEDGNEMEGWLIFYDEMNSGTKMVQAASYKVILDRMIAQSKLHERVVQVAAGNLSTDRAIVNSLSTAMQSRLVHLEMELNHRQWLEDVAYKEDYDERIIAYLNYDTGKLMDFRPDHNEKTFCCPRTWEFMNRLIKDKEVLARKTPLYAGTITSGVAAEFVQFCSIYKNMITAEQVMADPENAQIPPDAQRRWAIVTNMLGKLNDKNFDLLAKYVNRLDLGFQIMFFRGVMARHPKLRTHPAMVSATSSMSQHLHG